MSKTEILSAAFGRLRVETDSTRSAYLRTISAAFGRLRVETDISVEATEYVYLSRLRAAAC